MTSPARIRRLSRHELAAYLSGKGVSLQGVQSVKENGITGEMMVDFCEDDIRDAFSLFKDRFIIRKIIRETKSSHPSNKFDPYPVTNKSTTDVKVTQRQPGPIHPTRDANNYSKMPSHTFPMAVQPPQRVDLTMTSGIPTQIVPQVLQNIQARPYPVSLLKAEGAIPATSQSLDFTKSLDLKTESRVRSPTISSTVEESQKRHTDQKSSFSYDQKTTHNVNIIDFTQDTSSKEPLPKASLNIRPSTSTNLQQLSTGPVPVDLITLDERNRIQKYTADQLLEKKGLRARPSEAQHLGALAIRNAAQAANIWETAPLMRDISQRSMTIFKEYIKTFAPQMVERMDVVLGRLRESLQNRRKYLLDRDSGKRTTVGRSSRLVNAGYFVELEKTGNETGGKESARTNEIQIKVEDAGSLIDLTE